MDVDSCVSVPNSPSMATGTSICSMSVDELSNWLKTNGGIPEKFCEAFTGKLAFVFKMLATLVLIV